MSNLQTIPPQGAQAIFAVIDRVIVLIQVSVFASTILLFCVVNQGRTRYGVYIPEVIRFSVDKESNLIAMNYLLRRGGNLFAWGLQLVFIFHCLVLAIEVVLTRASFRKLQLPLTRWCVTFLLYVL